MELVSQSFTNPSSLRTNIYVLKLYYGLVVSTDS